MLPTTTTLHQNEIPGEPRCAVVHHYSLGAVAEMEVDFRAALPPELPSAVGVSIGLASADALIQTLALATRDTVFCLRLQQPPSATQSKTLQKIFSNIQYLAGFELPYTLIFLAHTLGSKVSGYDLSTLPINSKDGGITIPGKFFLSKGHHALDRRINERWDGDIQRSDPKSTGTPDPDHALRAWYTAIAANMAFSDLQLGQKLSTQFVDGPMLQRFVDLASRATRLDLLKPRIRENDFSDIQTESDGVMTVHNARFKTRIRSSTQAHLEVQLKNGDIIDATIKGAKGRRSSAVPGKSLKSDDVSRIRVIGREERTPAEQAQYYFLLSSLTATRRVPFFVDVIWFPGKTQEIVRDEEINLSNNYAYRILENLNNSQRGVVNAMLSMATRDSLVIAHGPPGTGKTTTIAAAAAIWVSNRQPCWIIAQSNVGVKNIAETLFKKEVKFKLIVSKDFLFEWHEDLYVEIEKMVIRSDELISQRDVNIEFHDITVVLCTVSMLSNPTLDSCGLFRVVPVKSLVIDEASQIDIFEFMHLFYKFSKTLMKVCFFGDPKQLPPYGAEDADLETIFEVKHLKKSAYFLDTQYRLPVRLGEFISEKVYHGKLRSCHKIMDYSCIAFIDVQKGEELKQGSSWKNMEEVHMVVRIAGLYKQQGLSFCIITFYDPQRAAIAKALEAANLPSTACVYNVDSFQGNEADYVILSSVRTRSAGFLKSQPRMNVGLTRCKKGMVVVTSKCFLRGAGRSTLLGKLEQAWTTQPPPRNAWIDWKAMLSKSVELPGLTQLSQHAQRLLLLLPPSTSAVPIPASTSRYNRPPPALSAAVTAAAAASINNNEHERARRFVVASTMFGAAASSSSSSSSSSPPTRGSSIRSLQAATTARRLEAGEDADDLLNERFPSLLPLTVALDQSLAAGSGRPASAVKLAFTELNYDGSTWETTLRTEF